MIDLKYGNLFLWHVRVGAGLGIILAIGVFTSSITTAIFLLIGSVFILTATEGTEINIQNKTIREYNSFFFLKTGKFESLGQAEYIFISKGTEGLQMSSPRGIQTSVIENTVFNAYLKLASEEKIQLLREKNKIRMIEKLQPLSKGLSIDILDRS